MAGRERTGRGSTGTGWGAGTGSALVPGVAGSFEGGSLDPASAAAPTRYSLCADSEASRSSSSAVPRAVAGPGGGGMARTGPRAREADRGRETGGQPGARAVRAPGRPWRAAGAAGRWLRSSCAGGSEGHITAAAAPRARSRSGRRPRRGRGWPGRGARPGAGLASGLRQAGGAASSHQPPGARAGFSCEDQRLKGKQVIGAWRLYRRAAETSAPRRNFSGVGD